jgi:holo-[acyl-carrier protein] synthase
MIIGVGIDLVDVSEFQSEIDAKKEPLLRRLFTPLERGYCVSQPDPYQNFAGTLAAKEATMKALGTGWTDDVDWQDIEIVREASGKPTLVLKGKLLEMSVRVGLRNAFLSISHTPRNSVAVIILEGHGQ